MLFECQIMMLDTLYLYVLLLIAVASTKYYINRNTIAVNWKHESQIPHIQRWIPIVSQGKWNTPMSSWNNITCTNTSQWYYMWQPAGETLLPKIFFFNSIKLHNSAASGVISILSFFLWAESWSLGNTTTHT